MKLTKWSSTLIIMSGALTIKAEALTRSTRGSINHYIINWTAPRISTTELWDITLPCCCSAHSIGRSELARASATLSSWTLSSGHKLTSGGITAWIGTELWTATVAYFISFKKTVTTLWFSDSFSGHIEETGVIIEPAQVLYAAAAEDSGWRESWNSGHHAANICWSWAWAWATCEIINGRG